MRIRFINWWNPTCDSEDVNIINVRYDWNCALCRYKKTLTFVIMNFELEILWGLEEEEG